MPTMGENKPADGEAKDATIGADASSTTPKIDKSGLYDLQQVKRLLDDEVILFMEVQGYEESTTVSNIKLVAGTIAVIAAVYSHFGVGEFPGSRPEVLGCVVTYLSCSVLITLASLALEASAVFVGQLTKRAQQVAKGNLPLRMWVSTSIGGKGVSTFRVEMRTSVRGKQDAVEEAFPYETYFTTEGVFLKDTFDSDMKATIGKVISNSSKKTQ